MLVDTMIPEAFEDGGNLTGLVTVSGFALAFLLTIDRLVAMRPLSATLSTHWQYDRTVIVSISSQ